MPQVGPASVAYPMSRQRGCPFDPPMTLRKIQDERRPVRVTIWDGSTPWLITGYERQRKLLADPRLSSDATIPGFPFQSSGMKVRRKRTSTFIQMDNPRHNYYRRMLTGQFTAKKMDALRPAIQNIVDERIEEMLAKEAPVDLVRDFALPVPSLVICDLLGVPYDRHDFFQSASATLLKQDSTADEVVEATRQLRSLALELIDQKIEQHTEDIIGHLVSRHLSQGDLTRDEIADIALLLLLAGHETTANQIALGTLALLHHPDQLALFRSFSEPAQIANAVEELLRYLSIGHVGRRRIALADIDVDGTTIRQGEGVIFPDSAGNWDEQAFANPEQLDLSRPASNHISFGYGTHQCLGQPLARVELQIAYKTLLDRIPSVRLAAEMEDLRFRNDMNVYGVYELPISW
jgi:cytochrome P450